MLTDRMMWDREKLIADAKRQAIDSGFRDENAIAHFVIGALSVDIKALQDHIVEVNAEIKGQHKWAKEDCTPSDKVFLKGYQHALNIISTTAGVKLD